MLISDPVYEFLNSKDSELIFSFHFRPNRTWTIGRNGILSSESAVFSIQQLIEFLEESVRFSIGPKPDLTPLGSHSFLYPNGTIVRFIHEAEDSLFLDMFLFVSDLNSLGEFSSN